MNKRILASCAALLMAGFTQAGILDAALEKAIDINTKAAAIRSVGGAESGNGSAPSAGSEPAQVVMASVGGGAMTCPTGGETYGADFAFCPKHGTKLVPSGGGAKALADDVTGMEFVFVEGGCFQMGDDKGDSCEKPAHEVCVDSFWIGKFEVTQAQYKKIIGYNPSKFETGGERPVEQVTWGDAQRFISELNAQSGKRYRLPTEAEWEFAARGGTKSKGSKYSGSDKVDEVAWFDNNSGSVTQPVGQKLPNELGIHDMSGNVSEWCTDWYDNFYYRWSPKDNPKGPRKGSRRVLRGGCWDSVDYYARVAYRATSRDPSSFYTGFRLALSH